MFSTTLSFIVGCLIVQVIKLSKENQQLKHHQIESFRMTEELANAITKLK